MRPDRRDLFQRLKEVEGVESWARLAPKLDVTETTLYRWRYGKSPISYEDTVKLLERAGYLNHDAAQPAEPENLVRVAEAIEAAAGELQRAMTLLAAEGEQPPSEAAER